MTAGLQLSTTDHKYLKNNNFKKYEQLYTQNLLTQNSLKHTILSKLTQEEIDKLNKPIPIK